MAAAAPLARIFRYAEAGGQIGDPAAARLYASGGRDIRLSLGRPRGIGGYADRNGDSAAYRLGFKTIEGLFLRAPSQLLLGFNWYATNVTWAAVFASLAAAR